MDRHHAHAACKPFGGASVMKRRLREAVAREELYLVYQPQVRLDTGRLVGVEALLRWRHPQLGEIGPARFVPIAETTGLIRPIGDWVLRRALGEMRRLQQRVEAPLRLAVNLSPVQLGDPAFPARLESLLHEHDHDPALLELEITETALLADSRQIRVALERLRALGCTLALDDFGTGYSSLSQVTRHPVSALKIDCEFVRPLPERKCSMAVVEAICGMASALGLRVVAEGIEHPAQLRCLRSIGCTEAQGFLFGPGVAIDDIDPRHIYPVGGGPQAVTGEARPDVETLAQSHPA